MFLGKVIGNVVATQKDPKFQGMKLLLVQPHVNRESGLAVSGSSIVAVDSVGAGEGELILFTQGSSARLTELTSDVPTDAVVVGIIDAIQVGKGELYKKPE